MKIVYFTHSLRSCWNHGNAHFLRGVLRELGATRARCHALEPERSWSLDNLLRDHGEAALAPFAAPTPICRPVTYPRTDVPRSCRRWSTAPTSFSSTSGTIPRSSPRSAASRRAGRPFTLLFHDTHHRAVSDPDAIDAFDLRGYDGVLAFGGPWPKSIGAGAGAIASSSGTRRPTCGCSSHRSRRTERRGLVWIGNWGDGERTPSWRASCSRRRAMPVWRSTSSASAIRPTRWRCCSATASPIAAGWPTPARPAVFARHLATVHVPRRFYVEHLPGIPTIRVFEALACGIPLVSRTVARCRAPVHARTRLPRGRRQCSG